MYLKCTLSEEERRDYDYALQCDKLMEQARLRDEDEKHDKAS